MNSLEIVTTARLLVRDQSDRLFMPIRPCSAKSRPGDGDFFGGKVDAGETSADAVVREFYEETGYQIDASGISYLYGETDRDNDTWFVRDYFVYGGRLALDQIQKTPEHIGLVCVSEATALYLTQFEPHRRAIGCL